jgi:AraC-like DNA-binding protein
LYDPAVGGVGPSESVRAWKPGIAGIREVLHASFRTHAYPLHTHDDWTVCLVDDGGIRYDLDRHDRDADRSIVTLLPPGVVHDGRPAPGVGYRKRVLYLDTTILDPSLIGPAVDRSGVPDPELRASLAALHGALLEDADALEAETRLAFVAERIRGVLGRPAPTRRPERRAADELRAYLDARLFERVTLDGAASALGAGPTHLARSFSTSFGIAPHRYVVGRRLDAARDRILAGQPLVDVAAETGFADQAHLTNAFRRFLGTTPGAFGRSGPGG